MPGTVITKKQRKRRAKPQSIAISPSNTPPLERPSIQDLIDRSMRMQMLEFGHWAWCGEPQKILKATDNIQRPKE